MQLLDLSNYREWIERFIQQNRSINGYQNRLAKAAGCQSSYISRVRKGSVQLTPDHGFGLASYWDLTPLESNYFLSLIRLERASSPKLRNHLKESLLELKEQSKKLKTHLQNRTSSPNEVKEYYYRYWYISAIHVLTSIPAFQTIQSIAKHLNLSKAIVKEVLLKLDSLGLVRQTEINHWSMTDMNIHMGKESTFSKLHHSNWRGLAHEVSRSRKSTPIYFTNVASISRSDLDRVQTILRDSISRVDEVIAKSNEETLVGLNIDFFEV